MNKYVRTFSLLLVFIMIASVFTGCKKTPKYEYSSVYEVITQGDTAANENTSDSSQTNSSGDKTATNSNSADGNTIGANSGSIGGNGNNSSNVVKNDITIKEGKTPAEKGLDLGGKTLLWVSPWEVDSKYYSQFEKTYNCKLDRRILNFNTYSQQVAALVASGEKVDIGYIYGAHFPQIVLKNLWQPLQNYITTADITDYSNPDKGGIDLEKSKLLAWNNNLYGLVGYYSTEPTVIFYNKKLLKDNGYDADLLLNYYKQGKWTYDTVKSFGKEFLDNTGVYFGSSHMYEEWLGSNDAVYIKYVDGAPVENLSDPAVYNALKFVRDMGVGSNAILKFFGEKTAKEVFVSGNTICYKSQIADYKDLKKQATTSTAFGKNADNVGIVTLPKGPDSKDKYITTSAVVGWASGVGSSNPLAAVAWAKMMIADNVSELKNRSGLTDEQFDYYVRQPLKTHSIVRGYYGYATSSIKMSDIAIKIESEVYLGGDITAILNNYRQEVRNCINVSLKQQ